MPQPVDLQTEVARVDAAQRIQQIADRASLAGLQRQEEDDEQTRVQKETSVQETHDTESREVDAEGRRQNPFAGRRRRRQAKDDEAASDAEHGAKTAEQGGEPHHIDVTV